MLISSNRHLHRKDDDGGFVSEIPRSHLRAERIIARGRRSESGSGCYRSSDQCIALYDDGLVRHAGGDIVYPAAGSEPVTGPS